MRRTFRAALAASVLALGGVATLSAPAAAQAADPVIAEDVYRNEDTFRLGLTTQGSRAYTPVVWLYEPYCQDVYDVEEIDTQSGYVWFLVDGANGYCDGDDQAYVDDQNSQITATAAIEIGPEQLLGPLDEVPEGYIHAVTYDEAQINLLPVPFCGIEEVNLANRNHTIVAGGGPCGYADGNGTDAAFDFGGPTGPYLLADVEVAGSRLYVADTGNCAIRQVNLSTRVVTTLAGPGCGGELHAGTNVSGPDVNVVQGLALAGSRLYFSEANLFILNGAQVLDDGPGDLCRVRVLNLSNRNISEVAGDDCGFEDGANLDAAFGPISDIELAGSRLYVADTENCAIRQVNVATHAVTTLASTDVDCNFNEQANAAALAAMGAPFGLSLVGSRLYFANAYGECDRIQVLNLSNRVVSSVFSGCDYANSEILEPWWPFAIDVVGSRLYTTNVFGPRCGLWVESLSSHTMSNIVDDHCSVPD